MRQLLRRTWYILRHRHHDADLAEEMDFHRALKQQELQQNGLDPRDARLAARRALGSTALAQDRSRDVWVPRWLQGLGQDFRLAFRALRSSPIVTCVAIGSLALGIGANTATFSLVNSLVLRALPVAEPEHLALVGGGNSPNQAYPYPTWEEMRKRGDAFGGICAWSSTRFDLAQGGEMEMVEGLSVSGDYFTTLGVPAMLGRTFTAADDVIGGPNAAVAVISHAFWQRRFGGAVNVIGTPISIDRVPFTIIGVTPPGFFGTEVGRAFDVAVPIISDALRDQSGFLTSATYWRLSVLVRLKDGQSMDAATVALRGMQPQIREAAMPKNVSFQATFLKSPLTLLPAASGTSGLRQQYQRPLLTLLVVVGLLLLVASANIANLLLARVTARRHELSVRRALGASPWRIARQFLVESLVLSAVGATLGLWFATWGGRALVTQLSLPFFTRVALEVPLDWRVMIFTIAVMTTTAALFGTAPAYRAMREAPIGALKEHPRAGEGEIRADASSGLIVVQVALSLVLVVAAGLFLRTFERLVTRPLGFDADRVVVLDVDITRAHVETTKRLGFYLQLPQAVEGVPGVASAAGSLWTPVSGASSNRLVDVPGAPALPQPERVVVVNFVTPGWFGVYGIPIRAGRDVTSRDTTDAPPIAIVNDAFVRRFLSGRNALGVAIGAPAPGRRDRPGSRVIVGVVTDTVLTSIREPVQPTIYVPMAQWDFLAPFGGGSLSVRSQHGSPVMLTRSLVDKLTSVDRDLALTARPLTDQVQASVSQERLLAILSACFGGLALLLAALGLYGVTSYAVTRRRYEIGIRMALGATGGSVMRLVMSRMVWQVGIGVFLGVVTSLWASQFVAALLYGLEPRDPNTLVGAVAILLAVAAYASWLPARRASRIDPAQVLREG